MSLTLYFHPLSSFCWKALIALYENDTPFTPQMLDLGNEAERAALLKLWPVGKFPVLRDDARDRIIPETEHHHRISRPSLSGPHAVHSRGRRSGAGRRGCATGSTISMCICRCRRSSATGCGRQREKDPHGVEEARARIAVVLRHDRQGRWRQAWAMGEAFGLADCAARRRCSTPTRSSRSARSTITLTAYLERLKARPSVARVLTEAEPYFDCFRSEDGSACPGQLRPK